MSKRTWIVKVSLGSSVLLACLLILASCGGSSSATGAANSNQTYQGIAVGTNIKVAMVPKLLGLAVFQANKQGAQQVAGPLNLSFNYTAPVDASAQGQVQIFDSLMAQRYNVITTTANNPSELAPSLERARKSGIKVVSYDSDVLPQARDFFVQNTDYDAMGQALVNSIVKSVGAKADIAVLSSSPTATIQLDWLNAVNKYIKSNYPGLHIVTTQYGNSSPEQSLTAAEDILHAYPNVKAILAPDGAAEPAAAEAVDKLGLQGKVFVTGSSDAASIKQYVLNGTIPYSPLWDEAKEGQVVMYVARLAANNAMPKNGTVKLGNLGTWQVHNSVLVFSEPLTFNKDNINNYPW